MSKSNKAMTQKSADEVNLSLIYSRLAVLENQSEKLSSSSARHAATDDSVNPFTIKDVTQEELDAIEKSFEEIIAEFENLTKLPHEQSETLVTINQEMLYKLDGAILNEECNQEELHSLFKEKSSQLRQAKAKRDVYTSENFRFRQELVSCSEKLKEYEELCRNFQSVAKDKQEFNAKSLEVEVEKTAQLNRECSDSIGKVMVKVEAEEAELAEKQAENESLSVKLEQFKEHLDMQKRRVENEQRAKELELKLEAAKKAQSDYLSEQERLKKDSLRAKVHTAEEKVNQLNEQLEMFKSKFLEFDDTLKKSGEITQQFEVREATLLEMAGKMRAEHSKLKKQSASGDVQLIQALENKKKLESEIPQLTATFDKLGKKCRQLQERRKELQATYDQKHHNTHSRMSPATTVHDVVSSSGSPARLSHTTSTATAAAATADASASMAPSLVVPSSDSHSGSSDVGGVGVGTPQPGDHKSRTTNK